MTGQPPAACSCGAQCPTHGLITMEDRLAAFAAGFERGIVEGRLAKIENDLDAQALHEAANLLQWVRVRTHALAADGPNWAAEVGGPKPGR